MASTVRSHIAFLSAIFAAALLGGCSGGTSGSAGAPAGGLPATSAATSGALSISGTPTTSAVAGTDYSFRPTASGASGAALTFAIKNPPGWAKFDPATGTLAGTPTTAYVGNSGQIVITVSDGSTSATLAAFSIEVTPLTAGEAALSWTAPTVSETGTELAGYHIYYGENSTHLTHVVDVKSPDSTSFVVDNLTPGTWYFAIKSYNNADIESSPSAIVPVTI
jgi:hypothetical protein